MSARTSVSHFAVTGTKVVWVAVPVLKKKAETGQEFYLIEVRSEVEQKEIGTDQHDYAAVAKHD